MRRLWIGLGAVILFAALSPPARAGCADQPSLSQNTIPINTTASVLLISGKPNNHTVICGIDIVLNATADNIALVAGTGPLCGTGTYGLAGGPAAATGWNFVASSIFVKGNGAGQIYETVNFGDNVCLLVSSGAQVSGSVQYVFAP